MLESYSADAGCTGFASDSILAWMKDVIAADADLAIRRMRDHPDDYALIVAWRNNPHVREWWDPDEQPMTMSGAIEQLGPQTRGDDPTTPCIIEHDGVPVGYIEFYPWDAEEPYLAEIGLSLPKGSWGLDIFIGESGLVSKGIGSRTVRLISDTLFAERGATAVALIMEAGNGRAQAAYTRAGMRVSGEPFLDTDMRDGQRVESILMIRDRPGGTAGGR
jgi:aminoglycoside 6'-N-acetyltransferase